MLSRGQATLLLWLLLLFTKNGGGLGRLGRGRTGEKWAAQGGSRALHTRDEAGLGAARPALRPLVLGGHRFSATAVPQHPGASRNEK